MDLEDCKQYVLFSEDLSVEVIDLHRVRQLKPRRSHLSGRSHLPRRSHQSPDGGGVSRAAVHRLAADGYGLGDRGREVRLSRTPLPPNRTGGFPAYGSPVSSVPDGIVRNDCGPPAD